MDAFSRRGLASEVDTSLPGFRIVEVLDRLAAQRGRPEELALDKGPVPLHFISPGKPVENAHIKSFHDRFRASA
jgi:putative transposase